MGLRHYYIFTKLIIQIKSVPTRKQVYLYITQQMQIGWITNLQMFKSYCHNIMFGKYTPKKITENRRYKDIPISAIYKRGQKVNKS